MIKQLCVILILLFSIGVVQAQTSLKIKLKGTHEDKFIAFKGYEIDGAKEYTYIFSHQNTYRLKIEDTDKKPVLLKIYDNNKKEVFSNYQNQKYYDEISFECSQTGIYYVKVEPVKN
jgi:hypothetical protein